MVYPFIDQRVNEDMVRKLNDPVRIARRQLKARNGNSGNRLISLAGDIGSTGVVVFTAVVAIVAGSLFTSSGAGS